MTITEFLLARIEADEAQAQVMWDEKVRRRAVDLPVSHNFPTPDRTLAECAAKRRIVEEARDYSPELADGDNGEWALGMVVGHLASVYADHPDYDEAWRA